MGTIAESFQKLVAKTLLTSASTNAFERHRGEIERRLESSFAVAKFLVIGSFERGSAVAGVSDLDLLVVLKSQELSFASSGALKRSDTVLSKVRDNLLARFPLTEIGRDGQAVAVHFSDGCSVDVVPAGYVGPLQTGWPLYRIPDGCGDWMGTAPDTHGRYIRDGDAASGGKLKSVARILKYWAQTREVPLPLSGFHVELLLTQEGTCAPGQTLSKCVEQALGLLAQRECRALQDPCGVSGLIRAASTDAQRDRLYGSVNQSAGWASKACAYEALGNPAEARRYWQMVFNQGFPS